MGRRLGRRLECKLVGLLEGLLGQGPLSITCSGPLNITCSLPATCPLIFCKLKVMGEPTCPLTFNF